MGPGRYDIMGGGWGIQLEAAVGCCSLRKGRCRDELMYLGRKGELLDVVLGCGDGFQWVW